MKYRFCCLLFLFTIFSQNGYSYPEDTIPPTYTWISPEEFSILTTNTIRLCVDARDNENGSGIKKVVFYADYVDYDTFRRKIKLGEINVFPYEFLWVCSHIPDQRFNNLAFFCDVIDNAGNVTSIAENAADNKGPTVILDRNPKYSDAGLYSYFIKENIVIDGNLNEWAKKDSIVIVNNDNKVVVYSLWSKKNLFFGIRVEDKSIIVYPDLYYKTLPQEEIHKIFHNDVIEIFLDTDHDHYEIVTFPDRHFLISGARLAYGQKYYLQNKEYITKKSYNPNVKCEVKTLGTLNKDDDIDTGYTIEFSISWEELGVDPEKTHDMGLEIWNIDKDYIDGNHFSSGWNTSAPTLHNPSEWGNIVFTGRRNYFTKAIAALIFLTCGAVVFLIIYIRRISGAGIKEVITEDSEIEPIEKAFIRKAKDYIEENYSDDTLSREDVARFVGLTPPYFSKILKDETGLSFTDYVTNIRIEKAKHLLLNTKKNVSEIAYEVGFNTQSYFGYVFKKIENKSPKEFRLLYQKHKKLPN